MKMHGLKFGGYIGRCPEMKRIRSIPLLSYHNPKQLCWLWFLDLRRCVADERRAFRYFRLRGNQDRRVLQFWNWSVEFIWQAEGRSPHLLRDRLQA